MARRYARSHLDFIDLISEAAVAVYMVIIINGYVALSQLNTQFYYILAVDIGACIAWGFIDGFTNAIGGSVDRGNQARLVQDIQSDKNSDKAINEVIEALDDTFVSRYSKEAKKTIAEEILKNSPRSSATKQRFLTRDELEGFLSIFLIYVVAGTLLSFPYVILPNKIDAWILSNTLGIAWLFFYGYRVGAILGNKKIPIGLVTAGAGIVFLTVSYLVYG
jgi:VIT1/CCC1 family predicted Fe2+/Mn2+ transporter